MGHEDESQSQSRDGPRAVAEHEGVAVPWIRIRNFNIAGIAWSNLEPGINVNWCQAIHVNKATVDVANVSGSINVAVMALMRGGQAKACATAKV